MHLNNDFAILVPMANEEFDFYPFINSLSDVLTRLQSGHVYIIVDKISHDRTLEFCTKLSLEDDRFTVIWAEDSKNVVDAYICGYKMAAEKNHELIIEMDAGLSHDPKAIPMFLRVLNEGNECAFGSRFVNGGSIQDSNFQRTFFSKGGTLLSNLLLGTHLFDMTSGYQGFHLSVVKQFMQYPFRSTGHFYQTELRYLLRKKRKMEVPIHYRVPSPRISSGSIKNSIGCLLYYFFKRIINRPIYLK